MNRKSGTFFGLLVAALLLVSRASGGPLTHAINESLPKTVKIYGAGGVRGLEAYQSGFLISADGHMLTAWSYVLDSDVIKVTLDDGRKFEATLAGADPKLEIAVLKLDATELPHFDLAESPAADAGTRVLALSNLFGVATGEEQVSLQRGVIAAVTRLDARRGAFESPYRGPVYVIDAMTNNPGAAGGALINQKGELLAILGKELRSGQNRSWMNYALPIAEVRPSVEAILTGKPRPKDAENKLAPEAAHNLALLGITLVPDVLEHTPPYIDDVRPGSVAAKSGLRRDDLVLFIGDALVPSCRAVNDELARLERSDPVKLVVKRGPDLVEATLGGE